MPSKIRYVTEMVFEYGKSEELTPLIRRVIAQNPSPFTFHGTGTYILGREEVAIIDPGPLMEDHINAIMNALKGEIVTHIFVTHTHHDHSPAAAVLKKLTGAKTYGYGPHGFSRTSYPGEAEESADSSFVPDIQLHDGQLISGSSWSLRALHTPGHTSNHLCFSFPEENVLFTGDHVMGWSTTVIAPPDGDMEAYIKSLMRLREGSESTYWPTHGPCIHEPQAFVSTLIEHRRRREDQIMAYLDKGPANISDIVATIYADVGQHLHLAAQRSVQSHLIHMLNKAHIICDEPLDERTLYRRA